MKKQRKPQKQKRYWAKNSWYGQGPGDHTDHTDHRGVGGLLGMVMGRATMLRVTWEGMVSMVSMVMVPVEVAQERL